MYRSLIENCSENFNLWILCMDEVTYEILNRSSFPKVKLVKLSEFETDDLLRVKKERTVAEYSWTCASNFIWFLLQKNTNLDSMTYIDADLCFFNDPIVLVEELGNKDVMITEHRYTKEFDVSKTSGKYCVQFMVFKNNYNGLIVLDWWRKSCIDWCFNYFDNGRLGDQKYLDDWLVRFNGVYEMKNLGGGVAPWNVQQYVFKIENSKIIGEEISSQKKFPLIFYHFHGFYLVSRKKFFCSIGYPISKNVRKIVYKNYFNSLQSSMMLVEKNNPDFSFGFRIVTIKERIYSFIINSNFLKKIYLSFKK